jgi:uncharacterized protein YjiS (DUF1127 family)
MLILHFWRAVCRGAISAGRPRLALGVLLRRAIRSRRARAALATVDRRILADIGIGPGAILSLARDVGCEQLRRPPHL